MMHWWSGAVHGQLSCGLLPLRVGFPRDGLGLRGVGFGFGFAISASS
jgi:hypothetical protein